MVWVDILILVILAVSALISLWRGFIKEAFSLANWFLAFWIALTFARPLASLLRDFITEPSMQMGVAFVGLFVATLIVGAILSHIASSFVKMSGLGGMDKFLGVIFGLLRGVILVVILVMLASLTPMTQDSWWRESFLLEYFQDLAGFVRDFLPDDVAAFFGV